MYGRVLARSTWNCTASLISCSPIQNKKFKGKESSQFVFMHIKVWDWLQRLDLLTHLLDLGLKYSAGTSPFLTYELLLYPLISWLSCRAYCTQRRTLLSTCVRRTLFWDSWVMNCLESFTILTVSLKMVHGLSVFRDLGHNKLSLVTT